MVVKVNTPTHTHTRKTKDWTRLNNDPIFNHLQSFSADWGEEFLHIFLRNLLLKVRSVLTSPRQKRGRMLQRWGGASQRWRRPKGTRWHHRILSLDWTQATGGGADDNDGGGDGGERAPEASRFHADRTTLEDWNISMPRAPASVPFFSFGYDLFSFFLFQVRGITACYLTLFQAYLKQPYPSHPARVVISSVFLGPLSPMDGYSLPPGEKQSMRKQFPPARSEWSSFKIVSNVLWRNGTLKPVRQWERAVKRTWVLTDH